MKSIISLLALFCATTLTSAQHTEGFYGPVVMLGYTSKKNGGVKNYYQLNANGNNFWINKNTAADPGPKTQNYGPAAPSTQYYLNFDTGKFVLNNYHLYGDGQRIYVNAKTGAMQFETKDHPIPSDAYTTFGDILGVLRLNYTSGGDQAGTYVCPHADGSYQLFFDKVAKLSKDCTYSAITNDYAYAAWKYE